MRLLGGLGYAPRRVNARRAPGEPGGAGGVWRVEAIEGRRHFQASWRAASRRMLRIVQRQSPFVVVGARGRRVGEEHRHHCQRRRVASARGLESRDGQRCSSSTEGRGSRPHAYALSCCLRCC